MPTNTTYSEDRALERLGKIDLNEITDLVNF